ncbi:MAG TPA: monovalent cation/H(+) antiporter subunit G [Synergistaceae bacterium]|nr:monovalent cation/H(+) antiporter subunit G [Synergistaceae bacterium]HPJ25363.1 monovalent cation/H(+) antiporter subunit G [Synergistaceae bacterium]HPQ36052.1 monovalent cation/H(+) antiporter subunit G [Synergistaceae bacterium]
MPFVLAFFLAIGLAFSALGGFALYRFPDVYTRLHGTTKCTTFGSMFISISAILWGLWRYFQSGEGRFLVLIVHVIIAFVALLITNATGAHAIARAAHRSGILPRQAIVDVLYEDKKKEKRGGVSQ